jgi:hypothetical protein
MNAPLVISSLGAFRVLAAAPIVVPPSVGTLFVGSAHYETWRREESQPARVITLSLTFRPSRRERRRRRELCATSKRHQLRDSKLASQVGHPASDFPRTVRSSE